MAQTAGWSSIRLQGTALPRSLPAGSLASAAVMGIEVSLQSTDTVWSSVVLQHVLSWCFSDDSESHSETFHGLPEFLNIVAFAVKYIWSCPYLMRAVDVGARI